jgi:hypothetical protein
MIVNETSLTAEVLVLIRHLAIPALHFCMGRSPLSSVAPPPELTLGLLRSPDEREIWRLDSLSLSSANEMGISTSPRGLQGVRI